MTHFWRNNMNHRPIDFVLYVTWFISWSWLDGFIFKTEKFAAEKFAAENKNWRVLKFLKWKKNFTRLEKKKKQLDPWIRGVINSASIAYNLHLESRLERYMCTIPFLNFAKNFTTEVTLKYVSTTYLSTVVCSWIM